MENPKAFPGSIKGEEATIFKFRDSKYEIVTNLVQIFHTEEPSYIAAYKLSLRSMVSLSPVYVGTPSPV